MADLKQEFDKVNLTKDFTSEMDEKDIKDNKIWAVLSYLNILFLLPLLLRKDSKFARFHVNQGIILFVIDLVVSIILNIQTGRVLGTILGILGALAGIISFVLTIIGIVNSVKGKAKELPFIGKFRILK